MRTWIVPLSTGTGVTGGANFELPADIKHHKCVGLTPAPFGPVRTPGAWLSLLVPNRQLVALQARPPAPLVRPD